MYELFIVQCKLRQGWWVILWIHLCLVLNKLVVQWNTLSLVWSWSRKRCRSEIPMPLAKCTVESTAFAVAECMADAVWAMETKAARSFQFRWGTGIHLCKNKWTDERSSSSLACIKPSVPKSSFLKNLYKFFKLLIFPFLFLQDEDGKSYLPHRFGDNCIK